MTLPYSATTSAAWASAERFFPLRFRFRSCSDFGRVFFRPAAGPPWHGTTFCGTRLRVQPLGQLRTSRRRLRLGFRNRREKL